MHIIFNRVFLGILSQLAIVWGYMRLSIPMLRGIQGQMIVDGILSQSTIVMSNF